MRGGFGANALLSSRHIASESARDQELSERLVRQFRHAPAVPESDDQVGGFLGRQVEVFDGFDLSDSLSQARAIVAMAFAEAGWSFGLDLSHFLISLGLSLSRRT